MLYVKLGSEVWDARADVTRMPLPPPDYAGQLERLLLEYKGSFDQSATETAAELLQLIKGGSSTPLGSGLKRGINRSTVHLWLRERSSDRLLDVLATRAHPEAFVLAFPSRSGWNSTHDPERLGFWRGPEVASEPKRKRPLDRAVAEVAEEVSQRFSAKNVGPLFLPNVKYRDLQKLRANLAFHQSLDRMRLEWQDCSNLDHIGRVVREHIKFIWDFLGYSKRSSPFFADGRNVTVEVLKLAVEDIPLLIEPSLAAFHLGGENPYMISVGPVCVLLKHLCTWAVPTTDWKQMQQASRLIVDSAIQGEQSKLP